MNPLERLECAVCSARRPFAPAHLWLGPGSLPILPLGRAAKQCPPTRDVWVAGIERSSPIIGEWTYCPGLPATAFVRVKARNGNLDYLLGPWTP